MINLVGEIAHTREGQSGLSPGRLSQGAISGQFPLGRVQSMVDDLG